jgi:hypothetical protein
MKIPKIYRADILRHTDKSMGPPPGVETLDIPDDPGDSTLVMGWKGLAPGCRVRRVEVSDADKLTCKYPIDVTSRHLVKMPTVPLVLVKHYRSDTLACMHQIESLIDIVKWHRVGNEIVNIYLTVHIPVNNLGYIGTAASTTKC